MKLRERKYVNYVQNQRKGCLKSAPTSFLQVDDSKLADSYKMKFKSSSSLRGLDAGKERKSTTAKRNEKLKQSSSPEDTRKLDNSSIEGDSRHPTWRKRALNLQHDITDERRSTQRMIHKEKSCSSLSMATRFIAPSMSRDFLNMEAHWSLLAANVTLDELAEYKKCLLKLITGRLSCLIPIRKLIPSFPVHLLETHEKIYSLLCQSSGAYAFKNHHGTKLISRHCLTGPSQIGAQILLECLYRKILPYNVMKEKYVLSQIQNYVRIGIKDMLEEMVERLPKGRNVITINDLQDSLALRLLE